MISLFLPCFTLASDRCPCNYGNYSSIYSFHINKMFEQNPRNTTLVNICLTHEARTRLARYEIWQNVLAINVALE
jgi:hypothetical protein